MHSPLTVAFEIRSPFRDKKLNQIFPNGYRESWVTIWHKDPEKDGTDDSCGWFIRGRHADQIIVECIIKRLDCDWDSQFTTSDGRVLNRGLFDRDGYPIFSTTGILLNIVHACVWEHEYARTKGNASKCWDAAGRFINKHYGDIALFAENPIDSMRDHIHQVFGKEAREVRIRSVVNIVYSWTLRKMRPWYKHPKWHIHHWVIQVHPFQWLRAWLFDRCETCGKGFKWKEPTVTKHWSRPKTPWFGSAKHINHERCMGCGVSASPSA